MSDINVKVNIEFYCSECGKDICCKYSANETIGKDQPYFDAEPCDCQTDRIKELEGLVDDHEKTISDYEEEIKTLT